MKYIVLLFFLSFLISSEFKLRTTQSVFQTLDKSDIYFHLIFFNKSISKNLSYGIQWWPSNNLYLSGLFSSLVVNSDSTLYHQFCIGYSNPLWKFKNISSNVIELGVHRLRYYRDSTYRWFHAGIKTRMIFRNIQVGFNFDRFFYNSWASNRLSLTFEKSINSRIKLNTGIILDKYNRFTPHFGVSLGL